VFNGDLHIIAGGIEGGLGVHVYSSNDGTTWTEGFEISEQAFDFGGTAGQTLISPSAAVYDGNLFIAIASSSFGNSVYWTRSVDGVNFIPWTAASGTSDTGPSLETYGNRLWMISGPDIQISQFIGDALPYVNLSGNALAVFGSADDDSIRVQPNGGDIEVFINNQSYGVFSGRTSVDLNGRAGNDGIFADSGIVNTPVIFDGGTGRDTLTGDAGGPRVFYNDGNDTINAADASDVQINDGRWESDQVLGAGQSPGDFNLVFTPIPGHDHQVVYTDDPASGVWTELVNGPGGGNTGNVVDNTASRSRIYQIIATPQR